MKKNRSFLLLFILLIVTVSPVLWSSSSPEWVPESFNRPATVVRSLTTYQMVFTTLPIAFAILHIILFIYFRSCKENFYFSIFLIFYAATIFFDYQSSLYGGSAGLKYLLLMRLFLGFRAIFSLRFVYSIFYKKVPRQFKYIAAAIIGGTVLTLIYTTPSNQNAHENYLIPLLSVSWFEIIRVIYKGIKAQHYGAWIVALGFFLYFGFNIMDAMMDAGISTLFKEMQNPYSFGTVGFLLTMSVYLARNYARTNQRLVEQERLASEREMQRKLLAVDNERKTKELEEARQLQLSMLPECAEGLPGLDICFHMTPAEEVGGDYYDFNVENNGTLVLTVGDATGHGMRAGVMVTSIKSIFRTIGNDPDIPGFFNKCTGTIKEMNMGNLYMALSVIRFNEGKLLLSSAGMPPIMVLRQCDGEVEEFIIKAPPLGGFKDYQYVTREIELKEGDILIAMSDGYPELFNNEDELLGYDRIKSIIASAPRHSAREMVRYLCLQGNKWRDGRKQEDDITFAVVRFKGKGTLGELCCYDYCEKIEGDC